MKYVQTDIKNWWIKNKKYLQESLIKIFTQFKNDRFNK